MSETRVFVSRPMSRSFDSPPKIEVMRRMKVDLPQPESAATPMTTAISGETARCAAAGTIAGPAVKAVVAPTSESIVIEVG